MSGDIQYLWVNTFIESLHHQRTMDFVVVVVTNHRQRLSRRTTGTQCGVLIQQQSVVICRTMNILQYISQRQFTVGHPVVIVLQQRRLLRMWQVSQCEVIRQTGIMLSKIRRMLTNITNQFA